MLDILLLLVTLVDFAYSTPTSPITRTTTPVRKTTIDSTLPHPPATGSGSAYAQSCRDAISIFQDATSAWEQSEGWIVYQTATSGGTSTNLVTYYENATTLCDGHARVSYSPAISLSTGLVTVPGHASATTTYSGSQYWNYPGATPSCSISPSDCDPLWQTYSSSLSAWQAMNASATAGSNSRPQITAPPQTPPCTNQTAASSYASLDSEIRGCNVCTIYGEDVQLVYFPVPTTVSRDMCATTQAASLTHYNAHGDDVLEAYAGTAYRGNGSAHGKVTAVANGHTFTSGTAYISIGSVWAEDRCQHTVGEPVTGAILAMSSQSVLSLRYSQDHFQRLQTTDIQTGYPVQYADFNEPVPYSAWVAQAQCDYGGYNCQVIYAGQYKPQLAIPPGIKRLNPAWKDCQMWYNGLWDPPLALQPNDHIEKPTHPHPHGYKTPSSSMPRPTPTPTPGWSPGPSTPSPTSQPTPTAVPDHTSEPSRSEQQWTHTDSQPSSESKQDTQPASSSATDPNQSPDRSDSSGDHPSSTGHDSPETSQTAEHSHAHGGTITIILPPQTDTVPTTDSSVDTVVDSTVPRTTTASSSSPTTESPATQSSKKPSAGARFEASGSLFYVLLLSLSLLSGLALGIV